MFLLFLWLKYRKCSSLFMARCQNASYAARTSANYVCSGVCSAYIYIYIYMRLPHCCLRYAQIPMLRRMLGNVVPESIYSMDEKPARQNLTRWLAPAIPWSIWVCAGVCARVCSAHGSTLRFLASGTHN